MTRMFFFKGVRAEHVRVSHGVFVGLPSLTGLTGLNRHFAIALAKALRLPVDSLQPAGALLAFEGYHLHEGYKKGHKAGSATYEALPAAWASFTAHLALEVAPTTPEAEEALNQSQVPGIAQELLTTMSLCKGSLREVPWPANLEMSRREGESTRATVLRLLPSSSFVVRDYGMLVAEMREAQLPLMECLVATALPHARRPEKFRKFFEREEADDSQASLAPVMNGYLKIEESASANSVRQDALGNLTSATVASPSFTIVRMQKAASVRVAVRDLGDLDRAFWRERKEPFGYFASAT